MIHLTLLLACGLQAADSSLPSPTDSDHWHQVACDDGGTSQIPHLLSGDPYTFPESAVAGTESERTCAFGDPVVFGYSGIDMGAKYRAVVTVASDGPRRQALFANDVALGAPADLIAGTIVTSTLDLPAACLTPDRLILEMRRLGGPNAVLSRIEILSTNPEPLGALEAGSWDPGLFSIPLPTVEEVNRLLPTYRPIPRSTGGVERPTKSLNGAWRVRPEPPDGWFRDPGAMPESIEVEMPGQFVQEGILFDPKKPVACFRAFEVDPAWREGRVIVRFEAVFSHCRVFVNGTPVGEHLGGMTAFEFDITDELREGSNDLALEITSWSDADLLGSLSQYTAHPLGGILRDVTLFTVPALHLTDLRIVTDLDEAFEDATLELELELGNTTGEEVSGLRLGIVIPEIPVEVERELPSIPPHSRRRVHLSVPVPSPRKWDPEHPRLHDLQLLLTSAGRELESLVEPIGFREIEVRGKQLLINGSPVKLRGANRHEVDPRRGRIVDRDTCIQDALLFREANCNYVRTSHYPPSIDFLDACDRLGLLVEVEAPLGWVGHGANPHWAELDPADPRWLPYQRQANLETVHFHRNHPSVLFWSLANESLWTRNFAEVLAAVQLADPSRPQAFHDQAWGGFNSAGSRAPIANLHYPGPGGPAHVATHSDDRPVLFGEYCHLSVYNRRETVTDPAVRDLWGLALRPMWEGMYRTPGMLGGALWSGIDDVFHLPDGRSTGYGPWGLIDGWRRHKPEFLQVRNSYAPVVVIGSSVREEGLWGIELENRFSFTNLDEVRIVYRSGGREQRVAGPHVAPGERGVIELETPGPEPLLLTFVDPREVVVAEELLDLPRLAATPAPEGTSTPECWRGETQYTIRTDDLELVLDASTGRIERLTRDGRDLLVGGPHLLAIPLHSDGCAPEHQPALPPLTDVCSGWQLEGMRVLPQEGEGVVVVKGRYDQASGSFTMRLDSAGTLRIQYDFKLTVDSLTPRQLGVAFDVPRALDTVSWNRRAEWTHYPEDHIGRARGSSPAFHDDCPEPVAPSTRPDWPWSHDATPLGCNDFRATRSHVFRFGLSTADGRRVTLFGDGTGDARAWIVDGERIRLLAASLTVPTGEMFIRNHFREVSVEWKRGAKLAGSAELRFPR
jgi:beta-galactosidase